MKVKSVLRRMGDLISKSTRKKKMWLAHDIRFVETISKYINVKWDVSNEVFSAVDDDDDQLYLFKETIFAATRDGYPE